MRKLLVLVAVAVCAGAVHIGTAHAALPPCGTITSSTTLATNCAAPLTIGASGITVNLGFNGVLCNSVVNAIVIPSWVRLSIVENGFVRPNMAGCVNGVQVDGSSNQVINIDSSSASGSGFQLGTGTPGVGSFNRLISDRATGNGDAGIISFGNNNLVRGGEYSFNFDDGISFFVGSGNKASSNFVLNNVDKGIIAGTGHTIISSNRVIGNSFGIYLSDGSSGSSVYQNDLEDNTTGIDINSTSSGNFVYSNTSLENGTWDMNDENAFCDADIWKFNTFDTSNQSCIH